MNLKPTLLPDWLASALSEGNGQTSMTRLIAFITAVAGVVLPAVLWFWISCLHNKLEEMPLSIIGFMGAAGTLATILFTVNKRAE